LNSTAGGRAQVPFGCEFHLTVPAWWSTAAAVRAVRPVSVWWSER